MNLLSRLLGKETQAAVSWIDTEELARWLSDSAPPCVIDVRGADEFIGPLGHIEEARNIPLDQIPAHAMALVGANRPVVFVCHTDRRSAAAAEHLRRAGGSEIAVLRGGMVAWRSRPVP